MPQVTPARYDHIASSFGSQRSGARKSQPASTVSAHFGGRRFAACIGQARDGDLPEACGSRPPIARPFAGNPSPGPCPACSRSCAATKTPMISTPCATIRACALALDKLPGPGAGLVSQPKMSRRESAPITRALARIMAEMTDSSRSPPRRLSARRCITVETLKKL